MFQKLNQKKVSYKLMRKLDLNNRKNYMRYIDYLNKVNHCKRETKVLVDFEKN